MLRTVGIVLLIWGLVSQSLMAAAPDRLIPAQSGNDPLLSTEVSSLPCHDKQKQSENTQSSQINPAHCENCETICATNVLCGVCYSFGAALNHSQFATLHALQKHSLKFYSVGIPTLAFTKAIYHPPK